MKKITAVCLVLVLCIALWFWGYNNQKSNDNIPSKELVVTYCQNQGENYAAKQLQGYKHTQLKEVWGQPDGSLFGFWGDIWEANNTYNLIVYYDSNGIVDHVKIMRGDDQEEALDTLPQWDVPPMVMVNGILYLDTGKESTVTGRCGMLDGEITSSVDSTEIPGENDQSNFGTGYGYQYGAEGTIEIFLNETWWIFATEEARQEIQFPSEHASTADAEFVTEDVAISNAVYLCQFVKDCLGEPDSFQIHTVSYLEEDGHHFYYLDFSHAVKKEETERTYYFAEFDGSTLLCIVNENSAIYYQTDGDYTEKYLVVSARFLEERSRQLDVALIASNLA